MRVSVKPVIVSSLTAMLMVACSAADIYGIFKPKGLPASSGSDIAYWLCFSLLCWSLVCTLAILRKLEAAIITKLFWLILAVLPFMILQLLTGF